MGAVNEQQVVWPEALALPCPTCGVAVRLMGVKSNLRLVFRCPGDGRFEADSWTSPPAPVDPCVVAPFSAEPASQLPFLAGALEVLLRAGVGDDHVFFMSPDIDHSVHFTLDSQGDGGVLAQVGGRYWRCTDCGKPPPAQPNTAILFELGFAPADPQLDYACRDFPLNVDLLAAVAERAFRDAMDEPDDFGLVAIFSAPELAEAFYLGWSLFPH